jgi:5-methylcytosine-specific restriction protein A
MPRKASRGCLQPGCPELAPSGSSYCPSHQAQQNLQYDRARGSPAARGYGARWRRLRAYHLRRHPTCTDPFRVHETLVLATDVDHILPRRQGGTDEEENLQSLCHTCHSRKSAVRDGRWG